MACGCIGLGAGGGNLQATVSASGAVNPVTQVSVGTQVSGQIKDLLVDFNSEVKAGQLIAVIDPETFEYRVRSAQADVDAARAAVLTAQANASASRASVSRAQVDLIEAQRDLDRKQSLVEKQFLAQLDCRAALAMTSYFRHRHGLWFCNDDLLSSSPRPLVLQWRPTFVIARPKAVAIHGGSASDNRRSFKELVWILHC